MSYIFKQVKIILELLQTLTLDFDINRRLWLIA